MSAATGIARSAPVAVATSPGRPAHTAIIMDGNGRWACQRGLPRSLGHRRGAKAVDRIVRRAPDLGISVLTLYAFSSDNWRRPAAEVDHLMGLFEDFLEKERRRCVDNEVRVSVIGRRDRLRPSIVEAIENTEAATSNGSRLHLRLAVDYSARQAIEQAAARAALEREESSSFNRHLQAVIHSPDEVPDVDLLIRTGGERRLSDFLLWESAYAELLFSDLLWPDFRGRDLERAVAEFAGRQRRFGGLAKSDAA